jgi:hypothetical protein
MHPMITQLVDSLKPQQYLKNVMMNYLHREDTTSKRLEDQTEDCTLVLPPTFYFRWTVGQTYCYWSVNKGRDGTGRSWPSLVPLNQFSGQGSTWSGEIWISDTKRGHLSAITGWTGRNWLWSLWSNSKWCCGAKENKQDGQLFLQVSRWFGKSGNDTMFVYRARCLWRKRLYY